MARILIAGCGDIGTATGKLLADDGHAVIGLKRNPPPDSDQISYIKADIAVAEEVEKLDTGYDLVICILTPDGRSEQQYRHVFEQGVGNLCRVFSQQRSHARFIFVSSTSVYGQSHGEWVNEDSVTQPQTLTGQIILQAEKLVLDQGGQNCIIRFSGIYGRGRSHLLSAVARGGKVQYEPPCYTNRIHRNDCVAVLHFIASKMIGGMDVDAVYLASDDDPAPKWEVFEYIAGKMGVESPARELLLRDSNQNKRCSNRRLKRLGYSFIYKSYREGYDFVA